MAYKFIEKSKPDIQKENAYIIFMIISSCYKQCISKNKLIEKNLFLHYKEMPIFRQQNIESQIIESINKMIGDRLNDLKCEATITHLKNDIYSISFNTWVEDIKVNVYKNGKYAIEIIKV